MIERIGRGGRIAGYDVLLTGDTITVADGAGTVVRHTVPSHGTPFGELVERPGFALGWGRFPDGAEVLYFYDRDDDNFGYVLNLADPGLSEWGYAPFAA